LSGRLSRPTSLFIGRFGASSTTAATSGSSASPGRPPGGAVVVVVEHRPLLAFRRRDGFRNNIKADGPPAPQGKFRGKLSPAGRIKDTGIMLEPQRRYMDRFYASLGLAGLTRRISEVQQQPIRMAAAKAYFQIHLTACPLREHFS
jgi:hypothetical protein